MPILELRDGARVLKLAKWGSDVLAIDTHGPGVTHRLTLTLGQVRELHAALGTFIEDADVAHAAGGGA